MNLFRTLPGLPPAQSAGPQPSRERIVVTAMPEKLNIVYRPISSSGSLRCSLKYAGSQVMQKYR